MRKFILLIALTGAASKADAASVSNASSLPVIKTEAFIVEIFAIDGKTNEILVSSKGFFVENNKETITLATVFHGFNSASSFSDSIFFFMQYQDYIIPMEHVTASFFPLQDLVFIHFPYTIFHQKNLSPKPLRISAAPFEKPDQPVYIVYPETIILYTEQPYLDKLSFMANRTGFSGKSGSPILDKNGNLVSVTKEAVSNLVFGYPIKNWNQLMKENNCIGHLSECIFKAREELYKLAKAGNKKAQRELLLLATKNTYEEYDLFVRALNKHDPSFTSDDMESFFRNASREYPDTLIERIHFYQETSDIIYFLKNWMQEEKNPHIYIKYEACSLMTDILEKKELYNNEPLFNCFKEIAEQGFIPAQRTFGLLLGAGVFGESQIIQSIQWLMKAAKQGDKDSCNIIRQAYSDTQNPSYCATEPELCSELQSLLQPVFESTTKICSNG